MTTLRPDALRIDARYRTRQIPSTTPETYGTTFTPRSAVTVSLSVDDAQVRSQLSGFDGMERPFALLPAEHDGKLTWYKHPLRYAGPGREGLYAQRPVDRYELAPVDNVDLGAVKKYGVAIGLETNVGTVWAQAPGQNAVVREEGGVAFWR